MTPERKNVFMEQLKDYSYLKKAFDIFFEDWRDEKFIDIFFGISNLKEDEYSLMILNNDDKRFDLYFMAGGRRYHDSSNSSSYNIYIDQDGNITEIICPTIVFGTNDEALYFINSLILSYKQRSKSELDLNDYRYTDYIDQTLSDLYKLIFIKKESEDENLPGNSYSFELNDEKILIRITEIVLYEYSSDQSFRVSIWNEKTKTNVVLIVRTISNAFLLLIGAYSRKSFKNLVTGFIEFTDPVTNVNEVFDILQNHVAFQIKEGED